MLSKFRASPSAMIAKSLLTALSAITKREEAGTIISARALACLWTEINPSRSFDGSPGATNCRLIHQASGGRADSSWTRDTRALIFAAAARCESGADSSSSVRLEGGSSLRNIRARTFCLLEFLRFQP